MSKVKFTSEQQEMLRSNQYTVRVTASTLSLSKEFKELFFRAVSDGETPREFLQKNGFPAEILGEKRIWGIAHMIKNEYSKKGSFNDVLSSPSGDIVNNTNLEDRVSYLEKKIDYMNQQLEFLKKISSIRTIQP